MSEERQDVAEGARVVPGLAGRKFLVTGASSGIGREVSLLLSSLGAVVVGAGRDASRLAKLAKDATLGPVTTIEAHLEEPESASKLLLEAVARVGPLDGFVHSAGQIELRPLKVLSEAGLRRLYQVNVEAALLLAKEFRKRGNNREGGSIVFVGSVMGLAGDIGLSGYCATKGALIAAVRSLALELAPQGIRVNCVAPGQVVTPMWKQTVEARGEAVVETSRARHPLGLGRPEQVAWPVVFLLSEGASWITGVTLPVDGGYLAS